MVKLNKLFMSDIELKKKQLQNNVEKKSVYFNMVTCCTYNQIAPFLKIINFF